MDADHDGKLSRAEWIIQFGNDDMFNAYDADGDGVISPEEWLAGQKMAKEFGDLDANGDGKISRAEWIARYGSDAGFDMYDLDGDGVIDADEFISAKMAQLQAAGVLTPQMMAAAGSTVASWRGIRNKYQVGVTSPPLKIKPVY